MQHSQDIKTQVQGRWKGVLLALGFGLKELTGRQGPCPICGGDTRFRFDDKEGRGTWICNACGAGDGFDLVMKVKGVDFLGAKALIEPLVGSAPFVAPKAERAPEELMSASVDLWRDARPLDGQDIASRYLKSRGLNLPSWPVYLRWTPSLKHLTNGEPRVASHHPAMLARFFSPDSKQTILHRTWLAEPGVKANCEPSRKMMAGRIPEGGAIRLQPAAETMGIAEGIETALAAHILFRVPVWAATSAGQLVKWQPPDVCKHVIIFGDSDHSFTGAMSAYSLAARLRVERVRPDNKPRYETVEVRFPLYHDKGDDEDWCDVLGVALEETAEVEPEWITRLKRAA